MKTPNYLFVYNRIKEQIEKWFECNLNDFEYKPYLWVHEYEDELDIEFVDTDSPCEGMYNFPDFCDVDKNGNYVIIPETIHKIARKWCFAPTVEESRNFEIPKVLTEDNVTILCERFRNSITGEKIKGAPTINIRYAVRDVMFHLASFGEYFFFNDRMYKIDKDPRWKPYHDKFAVQAFFGLNHKINGFAHVVAFCGIQTPFLDDKDDPIFTGDVCLVDEVYRSVTSDDFEGYGFAGDNCMLTLDMVLERGPIHRVGTIFYKLSLKEPYKRTWTDEICGMWGQSEDIKEKLKMAKLTPSFLQEDLEYLVIGCATDEFDWRFILDTSYGQPRMEIETKRVSPERITYLTSKQIFVFGSNKEGQHHGGAARVANKMFGAEWGVGEGMTGQCYAIPTMEGMESLKEAVDKFCICAQFDRKHVFLVTAIGCGIAGYTPEQIAPLFRNVTNLPNVYLPASFWEVLDEY